MILSIILTYNKEKDEMNEIQTWYNNNAPVCLVIAMSQEMHNWNIATSTNENVFESLLSIWT